MKKYTFLAFVLTVLGLLPGISAFAGNNDAGNWYMFFNQIRLSNRLSLHTEIQWRNYDLLSDTEQLLLRGGINAHLGANAFATAGYGRIDNYHENKTDFPGIQIEENRTWQQFLMRNSLGRIAFEHRYRLEQRWLRGKQDIYLDRVRYLLRATVPISNKTLMEKTFFLSFYNEVFIHFAPGPFDRNRLYGALGYQFRPGLNIQLGYLAQTVQTTTRSYLQTAVFYNIDLRKKEGS